MPVPRTKHELSPFLPLQVKEGICIVKTTQALIVGHYGENVQAGNATQTVEALADYLIGQGY